MTLALKDLQLKVKYVSKTDTKLLNDFDPKINIAPFYSCEMHCGAFQRRSPGRWNAAFSSRDRNDAAI